MVLLLNGCGRDEQPDWKNFPSVVTTAEAREPASASDHLVIYLDMSGSIAGYISSDRQGQTTFSRTLQELRNFSTILNPPLEIMVRRVDSSVGTPKPETYLNEVSLNPLIFDGKETDLAGTLGAFRTSAQPTPTPPKKKNAASQGQEDEQDEDAATAEPAPPPRFHILVTDGVQSTTQQRSGSNCTTGSDQICVRKKILELLKDGWGAYIIGMRSEFRGKIFSEVSYAPVPYESKKRDPESYRPFYLYIFSPDRDALDKMVEVLKERLRPLVAREDSLRVLALTSIYASGAAPGNLLIPEGSTDTLEATVDEQDNLARFTLLVDVDTEKTGPQPFTINTEVPWSSHARDGGTPQELSELVHWELVSVQPKIGEARGEGVRLPEVKIVGQKVAPDGKIVLEATAQWTPSTGDPTWRVYRLEGRLNLDKQTPPWIERWSTNLDTTADTANRTLYLESALLGLWRNDVLKDQVIAELYIRVGQM